MAALQKDALVSSLILSTQVSNDTKLVYILEPVDFTRRHVLHTNTFPVSQSELVKEQ